MQTVGQFRGFKPLVSIAERASVVTWKCSNMCCVIPDVQMDVRTLFPMVGPHPHFSQDLKTWNTPTSNITTFQQQHYWYDISYLIVVRFSWVFWNRHADTPDPGNLHLNWTFLVGWKSAAYRQLTWITCVQKIRKTLMYLLMPDSSLPRLLESLVTVTTWVFHFSICPFRLTDGPDGPDYLVHFECCHISM